MPIRFWEFLKRYSSRIVYAKTCIAASPDSHVLASSRGLVRSCRARPRRERSIQNAIRAILQASSVNTGRIAKSASPSPRIQVVRGSREIHAVDTGRREAMSVASTFLALGHFAKPTWKMQRAAQECAGSKLEELPSVDRRHSVLRSRLFYTL